MPRGDTSPCQPHHHSPSSRAKPTLSALNSGRCTNISMPLCPPTSSSAGESLAWRKEPGRPPSHHHPVLLPCQPGCHQHTRCPRKWKPLQPRARGPQNLERLAGGCPAAMLRGTPEYHPAVPERGHPGDSPGTKVRWMVRAKHFPSAFSLRMASRYLRGEGGAWVSRRRVAGVL